MRLSERELNRATLARQLLLGREALDVVAAVHRVFALQAQEPPSPYVALWNRVAGFDPSSLDLALARHEVVKATLMRITLHVIDAADYPAVHTAMQPTLRAARLNDRRFRRTGLSHADADALIPNARAFLSEPRTNAEAETWLDETLGQTPRPGVWWALRQYGPIVHAVTGGPWSFGLRPSYVRAPLDSPRDDPAEWMPQLIFRYLEAFGPATAQDIAQFGLLSAPSVREGLRRLGSTLVTLEGPGGNELLDVRDGWLPSADTPAPARLLPMWDSVLPAYRDRGRVIAPAHRRLVMRSNGDVLPTVLVDGLVRGVWRPVPHGIEISVFDPIADEAWTEVESEARALASFLAPRDPLIYSRYARWWRSLPTSNVRVVEH